MSSEPPPGEDLVEPQELSERLARCEAAIGHAFEDRSLLLEALTHSSGAVTRSASNERLEFLGDAILGAVVGEMLFHGFPHYLEGDLTRIRSIVVSRATCARIAASLRLDRWLIVGKGVRTSRELPGSLLAGVFESVVAAIYLDGGPEAARAFIERHMRPEIDRAATGEIGSNYKSLLQHLAQRDLRCTPTYQVVAARGPDHAKQFKVVAVLGKSRYHPAWGRNKKEAEQRAAHNALAELRGERPPYPSE